MKHAAKLPSRAAAASSSTSSRISAHRLSHAIAKTAQPPSRKIRIVHVLAPEIIKTEARNFRELVQRLTGKPGAYDAAAASPEDASSSSCPPASCVDAASDEVIKAEAEAKEEADTSSGGGCLGVEDGGNESFFQGLEDFLFSSCNLDGFSF